MIGLPPSTSPRTSFHVIGMRADAAGRFVKLGNFVHIVRVKREPENIEILADTRRRVDDFGITTRPLSICHRRRFAPESCRAFAAISR